jgi:hypothetical protein
LTGARIVWEALGQEPYVGTNFTITPSNIGGNWVEVEAQLKDGRRIVALTNFFALPSGPAPPPLATNANMVALYRLDTNYVDAIGRESDITPEGDAALDPIGLRVFKPGDDVTVEIPNQDVFDPNHTHAVSIEARLYVNSFTPEGIDNASILALVRAWNTQLRLLQDKWSDAPDVEGGSQIILDGSILSQYMTLKEWHVVGLMLDTSNYVVTVDGNEILRQPSSDLGLWDGSGTIQFQAGEFDGWIQNMVLKSIPGVPPVKPTGGNPTIPVVTILPKSPQGYYHFNISGPLNVPYKVECSTNLIDWVPVYRHYFGGLLDYVDTRSTSMPSRFYRAHVFNLQPTVSSVLPSGPHLQVQVTGEAGVPYIIQTSTDTLTWTSIYTNYAGGTLNYTDLTSSSTGGRFYRVLLPNLQPSLVLDMPSSNGKKPRLSTQMMLPAPYIIDASSDLMNWSPIYTNSAGTSTTYTDSNAPTSGSHYYRLRYQTTGITGSN